MNIVFTPGDINGIGPEIIYKARLNYESTPFRWIVCAHETTFSSLLSASTPFPIQTITSPEEATDTQTLYFCPPPFDHPPVEHGQMKPEAGAYAMESVRRAVEWCLEGRSQAMVTAPISKENISQAGYHYPGHTEFIAQLCKVDTYLMILAQHSLRVALTTIHSPLRDIPALITQPRVLEHIRRMHHSLINDFGISSPKIAVLGLNPHSGDGGTIGREEIEHIQPALELAQGQGMQCEGPFPADGFFGSRTFERFDGILAMYHDQGLAPFKALSFGGGVNFTAGLPIVRTSPDHGTAFAIAGKNQAQPSSLLQAISMALSISSTRTTTLTNQ